METVQIKRPDKNHLDNERVYIFQGKKQRAGDGLSQSLSRADRVSFAPFTGTGNLSRQINTSTSLLRTPGPGAYKIADVVVSVKKKAPSYKFSTSKRDMYKCHKDLTVGPSYMAFKNLLDPTDVTSRKVQGFKFSNTKRDLFGLDKIARTTSSIRAGQANQTMKNRHRRRSSTGMLTTGIMARIETSNKIQFPKVLKEDCACRKKSKKASKEINMTCTPHFQNSFFRKSGPIPREDSFASQTSKVKNITDFPTRKFCTSPFEFKHISKNLVYHRKSFVSKGTDDAIT